MEIALHRSAGVDWKKARTCWRCRMVITWQRPAPPVTLAASLLNCLTIWKKQTAKLEWYLDFAPLDAFAWEGKWESPLNMDREEPISVFPLKKSTPPHAPPPHPLTSHPP